jgi:hypothetical protein
MKQIGHYGITDVVPGGNGKSVRGTFLDGDLAGLEFELWGVTSHRPARVTGDVVVGMTHRLADITAGDEERT